MKVPPKLDPDGTAVNGAAAIPAGARVRVYSGYGYPASTATAIVRQHAPYLGRAGYYISWDYGRCAEQYESSGGWVAGNMITEIVDACAKADVP